jgi:ABC-type multidrug transport system fused ATPase/permease subunit
MKKTIILNTLLCVILISILSSCSIQKRRYSAGFHVEWHGDNNLPKQKQLEKKLLTEQNTVEQATNSESTLTCAVDDLKEIAPKPEVVAIKEKKASKRLQNVEAINQPLVSETEKFIAASDSLGRTLPPVEKHAGAKSSIRLMLTAYGLTALAFLAIILMFALVFSGTLILGLIAILLIYALLIIGFILAMIASVKAMFSLWEMNRTPIRFTNRWHANLAIVLGVLYLWFLFVIPLIIFFIKVQVTKSKEKTTGSPAQPSFDSHD